MLHIDDLDAPRAAGERILRDAEHRARSFGHECTLTELVREELGQLDGIALEKSRWPVVVIPPAHATPRPMATTTPEVTTRQEASGPARPSTSARSARVSVNRGLVSINYELHDSRGTTKRSRRCVDLGPTTIGVLQGWRSLQGPSSLQPASSIRDR